MVEYFTKHIYDMILIAMILPVSIMFITSLINAIMGPYLRSINVSNYTPMVSVLIPARNEENNIENCINSISNQKYPNFEVIILDDESTDNTYKIISKYNNIKLLKGKPLEKGWIGKNWACYQLSQAAQGEILIFTDADNTYENNAITNTVAYMQKFNLAMLSAFPEQKMTTFSEKLIIPLIDLMIYSFFILWSSLYVRNYIFSAANGQWLAIKQSIYNKYNGHKAIKNKIVDDTEMSRMIKKNGERTLTLSGKGIIYGKMYSNIDQIWSGLSKNLFGLTGNNIFIFITLSLVLILSTIAPYVLIFLSFSYLLLTVLILNIIWRFILSYNYRSNALISVILHPISIIILITIGINSIYVTKKGKINWKDRHINV